MIEDFFAIGEDDRYNVDPETYHRPYPPAAKLKKSETRKRLSVSTKAAEDAHDGEVQVEGATLAIPSVQGLLKAETSLEYEAKKAVNVPGKGNATPTPPSSQQLREAMKRKWDTALDEIDANDTYRISKYRRLEETRAKEALAAADASAKALLVRFQSLPTTPLVAITGSNKRRNTHHDILALIITASPDVIKRAGMPPKRDFRIMDISTTKKVLLSVFANAEEFQPLPGTVALFKHLTTHDYDGGSLNAYAKDCSNPDWFVPDPPGFENGEISQLKDCWARLQYSEQVALEPNDSLSPVYEALNIPEGEDIADHLPPVSGKKHMTCFYWAKNRTCRYSDDECAYAHYNTGIVAHDPMHNQNNPEEKESNAKSLSGLPPSRSLTCFFWARNRKCNRSDEECSYAHYDTGTIAKAPPGVTVFEPSPAEETTPPTKALTCYFWNRDGRCSRSDDECKYAHHATGLVAYPPPNVVASTAGNSISLPRPTAGITAAVNQPAASSSGSGGKSLTCFFWARNGHCTRSDTECRYAHYETGIVANNPSQSYSTELAPAISPIAPQAKITTTSAATSATGAPRPPTAPIEAREPTPLLIPARPLPTPAPASPKPLPIPPLQPPKVETQTTTTTNDTATSAPAPTAPAAAGPAFPPVKHLTCYFWANFGRCKRSDEECNYAHFQTGRMAVNPMELRRVRRG